jgi:hypothetical protein
MAKPIFGVIHGDHILPDGELVCKICKQREIEARKKEGIDSGKKE